MPDYSKTSHTVFHHRFHIVWITKYRKRILTGDLRLRIREIIAQVAEEMQIRIVNGVLSAEHIHLLVEIPPHVCVSNFVKFAKGRSSRKIHSKSFQVWVKCIGGVTFGAGDFLARQAVMSQTI